MTIIFFKPLAFFFMFLGLNTRAQIGVNTPNPNATLDIRTSNQTAPSNNDGILTPKTNDFPSIYPTKAQNGMLVFLTSDNTFYFRKNSNSSWIPHKIIRIWSFRNYET